MSVWWSAGQRWLEQEAAKMATSQKQAWVKKGRSAKTFRYNPPQWHRDAMDALGRNDEEAFKAIKLEQIGWPPTKATKKSSAQLDREIEQAMDELVKSTGGHSYRAKLPKYDAKQDRWTGGDERTLYAFTDRHTGETFVRPGGTGSLKGLGTETTSARIATKSEAEQVWPSLVNAGYITRGR